MMNERNTVWIILKRVFEEHGYASLIMRNMKDIPVDKRGFITECVYGTIRNYSLLEYQWRRYASHVKTGTALLLDMACYEIFFMNSPSYAVVNETVSLARKQEKGFVNALMHKVLKNGLQESDDLSIQYSHPAWMIRMWNAQYGKDKTLEILKNDQIRPDVMGRVNTLVSNKEEIEKKDGIHFINDLSFTSEKPLQHTSLFQDGSILIQNPGSIEIVNTLQVQPGMNVLDVCAAPGTKTQLMAMYMHNEGNITACDLYEQRVRLIDELMERTHVSIVHTKVQDAMKAHAFERESFDRILCDVPCSGLGDLSHKPEIRWHLKPENIDELVKTQKEILENASEYLKVNGILVYSTCTLNTKENERQISSFLKKHPEYELLNEKTIFPHDGMYDGFYMASLRKNQSCMIE